VLPKYRFLGEPRAVSTDNADWWAGEVMKDIARLISGVVGPFDHYCAGCPLDPEAAYVTAPVIGIGVFSRAQAIGSLQLRQTLAFDRAEADAANLTQANLVTVSSFNGIHGLLLGHDLLRQDPKPHLLLRNPAVFDAAPLLDASQALLGTVEDPHFPIFPGQHVLSAARVFHAEGPGYLYGAIAIAVTESRDRHADLFLEDGCLVSDWSQTAEKRILCDLVDSVQRIGENVGAVYTQIFVSVRYRQVASGCAGCALVAVPYLHLARGAVLEGAPHLLLSLPLSAWQDRVTGRFLRP
jgi:histidine decarboxylase